MKKLMFLAAIALAAFGPGCKKIKRLADINVDIPYSTQITVPLVNGYPADVPLPNGGLPLDFPKVALETNSKEYIAKYHTSSDKIIAIDLKKLSIQILTPPGQNFNFLDTVQLYISTKTLPEQMVAYQYVIPKGSTTLEFFTITSVNLKNYFLADTMYFRMRAHINAVPAVGTQLNIATTFHMLANPLE